MELLRSLNESADQALFDRLKQMLEDEGFTVSGDDMVTGGTGDVIAVSAERKPQYDEWDVLPLDVDVIQDYINAHM